MDRVGALHPRVCHSKAFAGIYGAGAQDEGRAVPAAVDGHELACERGHGHRLYLIGRSAPPANARPRFSGVELVAMKGRAFALEDTGSRSLDREAEVDDVLASLDGKFSLGALRADGLVLATDLIGAGPVYYAARGGRLHYATHLGLVLWLLGETPACDHVGAVSVLVARGQVGRETPFEGVWRLQAGERLCAGIQGEELRWSVSRYADLAGLLATGGSSGEAGFGELLEASLAREQCPAGAALMLSGGRDSKAIALAMRRRDVDAVTYGTPDAMDLRGAARVASELGLRHHLVPYTSWTYGDFAPQIMGLTAGASGLQTAHNVVGFSWAGGHGFELAIVGFLGDAITGGHLGPHERPEERHRRRVLCSNLDPHDVDVRGAFPEEVQGVLQKIDAGREGLSDLTQWQALMIQDLTVRQAGWISTMFDLAEWHVDVAYPFFYRPLLALMFNRPFPDLRRQRLYDEWLASAQAAAGIRDTPLRDRLSRAIHTGSSVTRLRRRPPGRLHWPDVTARSRPWLEQQLAAGTGPFHAISERSYRHALADQRNRIPTFAASIPLMLAVHMHQDASMLMTRTAAQDDVRP